MKEAQAIKFKSEWQKLTAERAATDHLVAKLANDIRTQFPDGEDGYAQAVDWCCLELGQSAIAARSFLADGNAWNCVRNSEHWFAIGGLKSARLIACLAKKARLVVLTEALDVADEHKRPCSLTRVRDIAWRHGFVEKQPAKVSYAKIAATLIAFVNRMYATSQGLPPMPAEIRAIVKPPAVLKKAA